MKRSEGNYNKQENNSRYKGDEPGFLENLKAIFSSTRKPEEREYLHDSQPSHQPKVTEPQPEVTVPQPEMPDKVCRIPKEEEEVHEASGNTNPSIEHDYIDFYTETSETDIYSKTLNGRTSTYSDDAEFYIEPSDQNFYTPAQEEEHAGDSTTASPNPDHTSNSGSGIDSGTITNTQNGPRSLSSMLLGLLAMIVLPYAFIFMLFMIPELDNSGEKYVTVETYRQNEEQEQRLREKAMEEERERREKEREQESYNRFYNKDTRTLTLPKTEFAGMEYAFAGTEAKAIRSAGVVSAIGDSAFSICKELETVKIKCKVIGLKSFKDCTSLRNVYITNNLNWLRSEAFANCPRLETVLLSTTLSNIEDNVFLNSNNIREVSIPNNVKTHFFRHLSHCGKINTIYLLCLDYFKMPKSIKEAPIQFSRCKLYVPDSKIEQFRNNADWSRFGEILPLSCSRWYDEKGWWKE